jgi:hypothetical protein
MGRRKGEEGEADDNKRRTKLKKRRASETKILRM